MSSGPQNALFDRGEAGERAAVAVADNSAVEHTTLPEAARRERDLTLTLSFETEEDRDRLIALLAVTPRRRASGPWEITWPVTDDSEGSLFSFLSGTA